MMELPSAFSRCCQRAAKAAAAVVDVDDGDHLLHKARSVA